MSLPEVTVVVPTRDRAVLLTRLLASLVRQTLSPETFEIVVVDNGSRDRTREVIEAAGARSGASLRGIEEPTPGASAARNRGIREARGEVIAFIDDDCEADEAWLSELLAAFRRTTAAAVGGRTLPLWDAPLPDWWRPDYDKAFVRNWGDELREVTEFPFFYSLNLAVRRQVLDRVGGFDQRLGPTGARHVVGEDADLCRRIHESGATLVYAPAALVRHRVTAERMTRRFLRERFYFRGITHAVHHAVQNRPLAIPYQLKQLAMGLADWARARSSGERFERELAVWRGLGYTLKGVELGWSRWRRSGGGG